MRNAARVALLSVFVISAACGGGDGTGPSDHSPRTISVTAGTGQSAVVGTAVTTAPAVTVKDKSGSVVSGVIVTFAVTVGGGSISGAVDTTDAAGIAHPGTWTLGTAVGTNTISATVASLTPASISATALPGPAASLVFTTAPSTTSGNGLAFPQQPVLQLKDQFGNDANQAGVSVVAAIASGGGTLGGSTTVLSNASGVVSFGNLAITGLVGAHTLSFTAAGIPVLNSGPITLTPGAPVSVTANSLTALAGTTGAAVTPLPSVLVRDGSSNPVPGASVTFAVASGGGTVTGGTQLTNASGIATVGGWTLGGVLGSQSLTAAFGALPAVTFSATVGPAAASRLTLVTQPSASAVNGVPLTQQPVVRIEDPFGNLVPTATTTVTVALQGAGSLGGTSSVAAVNGVASFTNLAITGTVGSYTLVLGATGLTGDTSAAIALAAGAPATVALNAGNGQAAAVGTAVATPPSVLVTDQSGNPVSGVAVSFAVQTGGGSVTGGAASSNASGIATAGNWTLGTSAGANTLTATAAGLAGSPVTFSATAIPGAGSQLVIATEPSANAANGVALAQQPVIQLRDQFNNPVNLPGVVVTVGVASGGGSLSGGTTATTDASGTASFSGLVLNGLVGIKTLSFSTIGLPPVTSIAITLAAGAPTQVVLTTQPSATAVNGAVFASQPVARIIDAGGNFVLQAGTGVTVAIASGGGVLNGTATVSTDGSGVATFSGLSITGLAGNRTLSFSASGLTPATSGLIAVSAGAATTLALNAGDGQTATAGSPVATAPSVLVTDQSGNPVSGVSVTFAVASGGGSVTGGAASSNAGGIATVGSWTLGTAAGANTLTATSIGLSGSPLTFTATATPGAASQLIITTQPSANASNGVALAQQPVVQLRDQFGNDVSQSGVVVTASVFSGGGSVGGGTTATTSASGTASFSGLILNGLVGTKTLSFSAAGVTSATSNNIALAAGAASQVVMVTQPSATAINGAVFSTQPAVRITDAGGNFVLQAGTGVTVAIASGGGALGGTATVTTNVSGVATFSGLSITGLAGNRTLSFGSSGLTSATSNSIAITASAATTIAKSAGDGQSGVVGTAVATPPSVLVTDQSGNPVSGVSVTFAVPTGGGSVTGGAATSNPSGIATVGSWTLDTIVGSDTLTATSAGLSGSPLTFTATATAGAASKLVITTQPSVNASNGVALAQQPVVQLRDQFGNDANQTGVLVTAAVASGGGSVSGGTTATTDVNGTASFSGLILNGLVGTKTLSFSAPSVTSATSGNITLSAGAAAQLTITTQPSATVTNGSALATQPVLQLRDVGGNAVSSAGVNILASLTGSPAGVTLGGTTTIATNASGIATYTNLSLSGLAGSYTLTFTKSGLTPAVSNSISLVAGAPASVVSNSPTSQAGRVGIAATTLPSVKVLDGSGNPVSGAAVTFAVIAGGGSVSGAAPTTDILGVATVGGWTLGKTVIANTVTATVGALPVVTFNASPTFVVSRVAGGGGFTCAVTIDGVPYCWGDNSNGNLGDGTATPRLSPVPISGSSLFGAINAGLGHTCGITAAGSAFCWGANNNGQLGDGSTTQRRIATAVSGGLVFAAIDLGTDHTCGVSSTGAVDCWGANNSGQLGNGATSGTPRTTPLQVATGFSQISSGVFFTCGTRTTGAGNCWGINGFGQLGDSTKAQRTLPTLVKGGLIFAEVVGSQTHSCGRTSSGSVFCWGFNGSGRLAQDTLTLPNNESLVPKQVVGLTGVVQLAAGSAHTCARTSGNQVYCWGFNDSGQLGNGTFSSAQVATLVTLPGGVSGFTSISAGSSHTCGVTSTGALYCWGDNFTGELGDGSGSDQSLPVRVLDP